MRKISYTITLFLFVSITQLAYSQAYTYYPFNSVFSISSNPKKTLWFDCRFQTNSYASTLSTEVGPMVNYATSGTARFYTGAGGRFNFLNYLLNSDANSPFVAYYMSFGTRITPIQKAQGLQFVFELSPDLSKTFDLGQIRAWLGVSYVFEKKKKL